MPVFALAVALLLGMGLAPSRAGATSPEKIVLISVDGLPAGSDLGRRLMPALAALADRGTRCAAARSPSPLPFVATVTLLTGLGPERTNVHDEATRGLGTAGPTLAASLTARGYHGLALPGDPLAHAGSGLARGFDRYSPRSPGLADSARADSALAWLRTPGRRFVWLGLSMGAPVDVWRRMDGIGPRDSVAFRSREREIDDVLAHIVRELDRGGMTGTTLIAIAGTSSPSIVLLPGLQSGGPLTDCAVPLVLVGLSAGGGEPLTIDGATSLADVAPTLVAAAGGDIRPFAGHVLASSRARAPLLEGRCDLDHARTLTRGAAGDDSAVGTDSEVCWTALLDELQRSGDVRDSIGIERLHALSLRCPGNPRLTLEWALAQSRGGHEFDSARALKDLVAQRQDYPEAVLAYADHLVRFHRFDVARRTLAAIALGSPLGAIAQWRDAMAMAGQGDFAGAEAMVVRASRLAVLNPSGLDAAATLHRLQEAKAATEVAPNEMKLRIAYGRQLGDFGLYKEAYAQLNYARARDQASPLPDFWIATLLMQQGRPQHASPTLLRGLARDSTHLASRLLLVDVLLEQGRRDDARKQLERALAQDPINPRAQFNLACLLATAGDPAGALTALERAVHQGYTEWSNIEDDPDLASVRSDPRYLRLIESKPN